MRKTSTKGITIDLTGEFGDIIAELQGQVGAESAGEVIRRAIVTYHTLVRQRLKGNEPQVLLKNEDPPRTVPIFRISEETLSDL